MALIADFKSPGPFAPVRAYYMISAVLHDRLSDSAQIQFALFSDAAARDVYKTQHAALRQAEANIMTQHMARAASADPVAAATAEMRLAEYQLAQRQAKMAMEAVTPLMENARLNIQSDMMKSVLTDGAIDLTKVYAVLKTLPQFTDAVDA